MRIGIIGAGAIGCVVGGLLTKAGHDVTLVDQWPEHIETMKSRGLKLSGTCGEYTIPVIFRLILGAGLRPPEARRLRRRDVDAGNAMVMIERSKRNKDRRVPVTGDLAGLLARFDHLADLRHPDREWFFEDQHGRQYSPSWLIAVALRLFQHTY